MYCRLIISTYPLYRKLNQKPCDAHALINFQIHTDYQSTTSLEYYHEYKLWFVQIEIRPVCITSKNL